MPRVPGVTALWPDAPGLGRWVQGGWPGGQRASMQRACTLFVCLFFQRSATTSGSERLSPAKWTAGGQRAAPWAPHLQCPSNYGKPYLLMPPSTEPRSADVGWGLCVGLGGGLVEEQGEREKGCIRHVDRSGTVSWLYFLVQIKNPFVQLDLCLVTALCIFHCDVNTWRTQHKNWLHYAPSALWGKCDSSNYYHLSFYSFFH